MKWRSWSEIFKWYYTSEVYQI